MAVASNLGYPRIGPHRELKAAQESFWRAEIGVAELMRRASEIRRRNWALQREAGIAHVPCNDFSLYDHVLDTTAMLGAVPRRFGWPGERVDPATYFAMARGASGAKGGGAGAPAMEMTKWFDTNYHYIVPEFEEEPRLVLS